MRHGRHATILFLFFLQAAYADNASQPPVLSLNSRTRVTEFRFEGNTVFTSAELAKITAPFTDRELSFEELDDARRAVTLHYVQHGYLSSGAVLGNPPARDGIVTLRIIEGRLTNLKITGQRWLRPSFLESRIRHHSAPPLNVNELRDGLQLLRFNPNIEQINAELQPGTRPGESCLDVRVRDRQPFQLGIQVDNERPPSVGAYEVLVHAADRNLTGQSDPLDVTYGLVEGGNDDWKFSGLDNFSGSYTLPFTPSDTTLILFGSRNNFSIIEEPAGTNTISDISSESHQFGGMLRQPLYQTAQREFTIAVTLEHRSSQLFQNGNPAPIVLGADENGEMNLTVLRFSQEWVSRNVRSVFALRSTFSIGLNAFNATDDGTDRDAKFFAWLGQAQYLQQLFNTRSQLLLRADGQWTPDQLLSLEQFTIGGSHSVRGYRENQLVRDRGFFTSAEVRIPILINRAGAAVLQIAPFVDYGGGWNRGSRAGVQTLASTGVGLLLTPNRHTTAQLYWAHAFRDFRTTEQDAQDIGLHFRVNFEAF